MSFDNSKYSCIVSIDLGTTFSGSCYVNALKVSEKDREAIRAVDLDNLPAEAEVSYGNGIESEKKAPTIIIYDDSMNIECWGTHAAELIKKGLPQGYTVREKFKMSLPTTPFQKSGIQMSSKMKFYAQESNFQAAVDYFRVIYNHIFGFMCKTLPTDGITTLKLSDVRFIVTVPAMWNDMERNIMRNVILAAKLISEDDHESRLIVINESLAATLYCEREYYERDLISIGDKYDPESNYGLQPGDRYIICDAGGGTVDIASFVAVKADEENMNFTRCQLTADSGDNCGSVYIDEAMEEFLWNLFIDPSEKNADNIGTERRTQIYKNAISEAIREQFSKSDGIKHKFGLDDGGGQKSDKGQSDKGQNDKGKSEEDLEFLLNGDSLADLIYDGRWNYENIYGVKFEELDRNIPKYTIKIPYSVMAAEVFDKTVSKTVDLLRKQIKKISGPDGQPIKATFLVGGFGSNRYLKKKIEEEFVLKTDEDTKKEKTYRCGEILQPKNGNLAAMKGAAQYGKNSIMKPAQTDIIDSPYSWSDESSYDTLVCIDIGYDYTSCSYLDLSDSTNCFEPVEKFPTALYRGRSEELQDVETSVPEDPVMLNQELCMVKDDLKAYFRDLIKHVSAHVYRYIKSKGGQENRDCYRYCFTMEDSYPFFSCKQDMRNIAIEAGLIRESDDSKRLLLIKRGDAIAMHLENSCIGAREPEEGEVDEEKAPTTRFLQVSFYHNICHLSLQEATQILGHKKLNRPEPEMLFRGRKEATAKKRESSTDENEEEEKNDKKKEHKEKGLTKKKGYFRNVRSLQSATFEFNFIEKLVYYLNEYVTNNERIYCNALEEHPTEYENYTAELREGFLHYIEHTLDFSTNEHLQRFKIKKEGCCEIYTFVYDLLEHVFRPAIRDFMSDFSHYATEVQVVRYNLKKVFLLGNLIKAKPATYTFLEGLIKKEIMDVAGVKDGDVVALESDEQALLGAEIYVSNPSAYSERIARKTYAVTVEGFYIEDFSSDVNTLKEEAWAKHDADKKKRIKVAGTKYDLEHDIESENAFKDHKRKERVDLFLQSSSSPSKVKKIDPNTQVYLITNGTKIKEEHQYEGIEKIFYAQEKEKEEERDKRFLVYVGVYVTEKYYENDELVDVPLSEFQKVHQFEVYLKKHPNDPMRRFNNSRIPFYVRLTMNNNEAILEAGPQSKAGTKSIPDFRFRDEILFAQIYHDGERISSFTAKRTKAEEKAERE